MPNMHEKPLPGVVSTDFEDSPTVIETEDEYEEFMVEPSYGMDPDYDPVPVELDPEIPF